MAKAKNVTNPKTPALLDKVFIDMNTKLLSKINWLTRAYGKAQTMTTLDEKKREVKTPIVFTGVGKEYINMLPEEDYGNFCFWRADDYEIEPIDNQLSIVRAEVSVIFWLNINKVLEADELRNMESIKEEIMLFFSTNRVLNSKLILNGVSEDNKTIYKEYSIKEMNQQYLMHPFGALRFNGTLEYEKLCNA